MSYKNTQSRLVYEIALIGVALIITYLASGHLSPSYVSTQLSSGVGQTGWPFAYWMKTWVEENNKGYEQSTFSVFFFACDILIVYSAIRLAVLLRATK